MSQDGDPVDTVTTTVTIDSATGESSAQARFGMFGGVFTPCVLTILGVIMFMRTGFVAGHTGLWLGLAILLISKSITTLTTLSLSAIASNTRVKAGGLYYMVSRALGPDFGGSIGLTLFLAQAVSVAFYTIGFTEALMDVVTPLFGGEQGVRELIAHFRLSQITATVVTAGLFALTFRGADLVIKVQYGVLAVLLLAVASFLVGGGLQFDSARFADNSMPEFTDGMSFWVAFAIFFPATTGISAGANMSGDLKSPARALPAGTLLAILFTAVIYVAQLVLCVGASPRSALKGSAFLALQEMSVFGPLIVLGVFAATLSSALGSFLGAPRILQAIGKDRLLRPLTFFGKGSGATNEPRRATVLSFGIAVAVIWAGDLNAVAEVISMFFLIAYGMINLSAFVESKGANPSFRPQFRFFHWSLALAGAVGCGVAMVKINETYALLAFGVVGVIYFYLRKKDIQTTWGDAKRGYVFQATRNNLLYLEQNPPDPKNWRPILVAITEDPKRDRQLLRVGAWLESERGLYTVAHVSERPAEDQPARLRFARRARAELREQLDADAIAAFVEAAGVRELDEGLFLFMQSYSVGGLWPNTVALALPSGEIAEIRTRFLRMMDVLVRFDLNLAVLKPGDMTLSKKRRTIDLWWRGYKNGSLMAMFAYLVSLDDSWQDAQIRIMRIVRDVQEEQEAHRELGELKGRARIGATIEVIRSDRPPLELILERSGGTADLVFLGMAAASGEEFRGFLEAVGPTLERLPTTVLIASNGEADVFV